MSYRGDFMEKLGNFLQTLQKPKILDVGTGGGNFIQLLTSQYDDFESIVGIDNLDIAISTSRKNFQDDRITFEKMDAHSMTFNDGIFDVVCLSNSLHHLEKPDIIFKEMERVLKTGGVIIVNEMMRDHLSSKQITHLKLHHFAAEIDRELGDTHNETYKREEIIDKLNEISTLTIKDSWDMRQEQPTENTKEEIDWLLQTIDRLSDRLQDEEKRQFYKKKGERIKEYVLKVGFESATQLLVVLG